MLDPKRQKGEAARGRAPCDACGRKVGAPEPHRCAHGAACGDECDECFRADLERAANVEELRVRQGLFGVELSLQGLRVKRPTFRRILAAISAEWDS